MEFPTTEFFARPVRLFSSLPITAGPSIRLAALSKLPNIYIFTHDSIGVGEDGPTHEPVETVSSVRVMPQIDVIRPADPEETAGAFVAAAQHIDGPTLIALTRQAVPILNEIDVALRREGVARGGYIAKKETGDLEIIIMSCGSELQHALAAAKELGEGVRVVSMPCFERFDRQPAKYREEVLPNECRKRIAIEAGVPDTWYQYVGLDGKVIGLHRFGLSAPGAEVMKEFGIDAEHVIEAAESSSVAVAVSGERDLPERHAPSCPELVGVDSAAPSSAQNPSGSATFVARVSKRVNSLRNVSGMSPTGPLRCLEIIRSALPAASSFSSSVSA